MDTEYDETPPAWGPCSGGGVTAEDSARGRQIGMIVLECIEEYAGDYFVEARRRVGVLTGLRLAPTPATALWLISTLGRSYQETL